jgi:PD-(D/E)XK nuclease superfamily
MPTSIFSVDQIMSNPWLPYISYSIWSLFQSAIGQESSHCARKRGFAKVRNKEERIKSLVRQDNIAQTIGHLAQRGVYEFQHNPHLISQSDGVERVGEILELEKQSETIQSRIFGILKSYCDRPILADKKVLLLNRGDEGFPPAIIIGEKSNQFKLYAGFDCLFVEPDNRLHILDFKTGKSSFDKRQAYVYLFAAKFLHPDKQAVASFYNLESQELSEPIELSETAISSLQIELYNRAKQLQKEKQYYEDNPEKFSRIFPANPSHGCAYCNFQSVCEFAVIEE